MPRGIVEDVLIRVGEFISPVDFVVIETKKVSNLASQVPVILGILSWPLSMPSLTTDMV